MNEEDNRNQEMSDYEYEAYLDNGPRADAWAEFVMTGKSSALADYLSMNGEFDEHVRNMVITVLREGPFKNPGGKNLWRDYKTYCEIKGIMFKSKCSLRQAQLIFCNGTGQELRTVQLQYKRGEAVFK